MSCLKNHTKKFKLYYYAEFFIDFCFSFSGGLGPE